MNSFDLNVAFHCFGTMLSVEGLVKRLGLGLVQWRKSDVSVSSRSRGIAGRSWSRSRLGLVSQGLVYIPG